MPLARPGTWLGRLSVALAALYVADRGLKLAAVAHFFRRPPPSEPTTWPAVSLLQPITCGASDLAAALAARAALHYTGPIQHLLICDAQDERLITQCRHWAAAQPAGSAEIVLVDATTEAGRTGRPVASKIVKLRAALPRAAGELLFCIDDDVAPRPDALQVLVTYLLQPGIGAVFGLANYVNWSNVWSSLMSGFVNANALMSYVPLAYLTDPYTITGHFFGLRRADFDAAGGLEGLEERLDDDHELARRVRRLGLRCVQTSVVYDVDNYLPSRSAYANQMRRWFTIPRVTMAPYLTRREETVTLIGSISGLFLPLLAVLALDHPARRSWGALATAFASFVAAYSLCESAFTHGRTPPRRWPLVLTSALIAPVQALMALLGGNRFEWRGQQVLLNPDGKVTILPHADRG